MLDLWLDLIFVFHNEHLYILFDIDFFSDFNQFFSCFTLGALYNCSQFFKAEFHKF